MNVMETFAVTPVDGNIHLTALHRYHQAAASRSLAAWRSQQAHHPAAAVQTIVTCCANDTAVLEVTVASPPAPGFA